MIIMLLVIVQVMAAGVQRHPPPQHSCHAATYPTISRGLRVHG